jgi:hypothetical protein
MSEIFIKLLPLILASALVPIWIILMLLILRSPNGVRKGAAFLAGATLVRLCQGIVFGYLLGNSEAFDKSKDGQSPVVSTLFIVLGILLLIVALKKFCKEPDVDEPLPKWMSVIENASVSKVFVLAIISTLVAVKLWVFTLLAIEVIRDGTLSYADSMIMYLIFILGAESLLLLPLLLCAIAPTYSTNLLQSATNKLS